MQILKMHNLTQNYRINLAARGILQSHGTLRHMTVESNNGIVYVACPKTSTVCILRALLTGGGGGIVMEQVTGEQTYDQPLP